MMLRSGVTVIDAPQRSEQWFAARCGRITSSVVAEALAKTKSKEWSTSRANLRTRLVLERLTQQPIISSYRDSNMDRGVEMEPDALAAYEAQSDALVLPVGFVSHDTLMAGASPDGLVGDDGVVEIKCPIPAIHLDYLRGGLPNAYRLQILHTLWMTGRAWGDFVSYCPAFPDVLRLAQTRIVPTVAELAEHEDSVKLFLAEADKELEDVLAMVEKRRA